MSASASQEGSSPAGSGRSCTVVVSTRDRPESLAACLRAVSEQRYPDLEVVVVDSAPRHSDARSVAAAAGVRYLRVERPGLSRARNAGARLANGDVVLFLDDDVTVAPGCITALLDEFVDPHTIAVGGRLLLSGGDNEARMAFEAFGGFDPGPERRVVDCQTSGWFELTNFGGLGTGGMLAIRRDAFDSWPGFDERLGRGAPMRAGEELLAYFVLVDGGYRVAYTPHAVARHPAPASFAKLRDRILEGAVTASAYLTLLLVEHPRHRRAALAYALQAVRGRVREWRPRPAAAQYSIVPRWRHRIAWLRGPLVYARMRATIALERKRARAVGRGIP